MLAVALGADHAGWELKEALKAWLMDAGYQVPEAVSIGKVDRGLLVCGTGIGMAIAANKMPGIRAALCGDVFTARMSREHNDANVLAMGGRLTGRETGLEILRAWLETPFAGGRHARRVDKITEIERGPSRARSG